MTNTIEQVIAYAHAHPTRDGGTWHNWCESFVWRAGGFNGSFGSAQLAGNASGPLNPNWAAAPAGAIHYWSGAGDGHVGFSLGGGLCLMASNGVTTSWGTAIGTATIPEYNARKTAMSYRGWTMRHGVETLAPSAAAPAASTPPTPITTKARKKNKMYLVWDTIGSGYLVTDDGFCGLASPQIYNLFYRLINSDQSHSPFGGTGTPDTFNKAETDMMNSTLKLMALSNRTGVAIDVPKLASALSDALGTKFDHTSTAVVDPTVLAAAFDIAVPRIAKAVNDVAAQRLAN